MLSWARYRRDGDWPTDSGERGEWLAAARTVGRGGRAARWPSPGLLPSCHFRGAAPEILTGILPSE